MTDIKEQLGDHQQRIGELERRVSDVEDARAGQHRVIRYLFQCKKLTGGWNINVKRRKTNMLAIADLKAMIQEEDEDE